MSDWPQAKNVPACRVYNSADIAIVTATVTTLTFDTELFDNDVMHDPGTNPGRITFKTAGYYVVSAGIEWAANATGERALFLRDSGANLLCASRFNAVAATTIDQNCGATQYFDVNDYITAEAYHTRGSNLSVLHSADYTPILSAILLGT